MTNPCTASRIVAASSRMSGLCGHFVHLIDFFRAFALRSTRMYLFLFDSHFSIKENNTWCIVTLGYLCEWTVKASGGER